jgi:sulfur-oxidizing protein SoxY
MKRRDFVVAGGAIGAAFGLGAAAARATPAEVKEAILQLTGDAPVRVGRVALDLPPLVENGNSVPLTIHVDSPMTAADHVKAVHVFVEKNPQPYVASFHLGPRAGRASVSTRIRLADSQTVVTICEMSDGSFWSGSAEALVTLAACTEPSS